MRKPYPPLLCALLLTLTPALAMAAPTNQSSANESGPDRTDPDRLGGSFSAYGKVLKVTPIVRRETIIEPFEECRVIPDRQQTRYSPHRRRHIEPPHRVLRSIVGSLIGGAVGNQFGGGNGKKALTVLGAIAGARVANAPHLRHQDDSHSVYRDYRHADSQTIAIEQCTQTERSRAVEQITGYRVRYRYNGETYTKITKEHPGKRIPLEVRVTPRIYPRR